MTNYITVMMIYLYKMAHSTFIVTDTFPPWWDFAMVGICRQAMTMMTMIRMMTTTMILSVMFSPHIYSSHQESSVPCLEELQVNNLKVYNSQILVESTFESAINVDGDTFVQKINF